MSELETKERYNSTFIRSLKSDIYIYVATSYTPPRIRTVGMIFDTAMKVFLDGVCTATTNFTLNI
jgi:hypothetical protein